MSRGDATDEAVDARPGAFAAFRFRNFRLIWIGAVISNSGRWFQSLAVPIVLWDLTESAGWVGFVGFSQQVPAALLGPVAGALADRYARRNVLIVTQSLQAVAAVGFVVMWFAGVRAPAAYAAAAAGAGIAAGLNLPAWQAFVSELVPRDYLMSAITLNSAQFNVARLVGPVAAGFAVAWWGAGWAFAVNAVTYLAVIAALVLVRVPTVTVRPDGRMRPLREFVETLGYVRRRRGIVAAIGTVSVIGFFGLASQQMSIALAEDVFDRPDSGFGLMLAAAGLGAVLASPVIAYLSSRVRRSIIQRTALVVYGSGILLAGLAPWFGMALVGLFVMGAAHIASASTLNTAIQMQVDEIVRAKVLSVYITVLLLAMPLGMLVQGQTIDRFGPRETYTIAGAVMLGIGVIVVASRGLRDLDLEVGSYEPLVAAEVHPTTPAPPR